jgi:iron(III) transport system substrate-binding protein
MASVLAALGEYEAEKWAKAMVANFAKRPQGNDRAQVKAIHEGECELALINNYYYGKLKFSEDPEQRKWAESVRLVFPNQAEGDRGAHVNISGGGVAKYSSNKEEAQKLLEFLTSKKAQKLYGEINFEYPANLKIEPGEELQSWGSFREDTLPIIKIAELAPNAQMIIDRVGW